MDAASSTSTLYIFLIAATLIAAYLVRRALIPSPLRLIPGPPAESWFKGNLGQLFNAKGLRYHHDLVERYGGVVKVHGFFGDEQLYISDPRALHSIILSDHDAFEETRVFIETNKVIFGEGLVATTGEHHKRQRKIVLPIFSTANLRRITPVFYEIAHKLVDALASDPNISTGAERNPIDMASWMSRVALESVGQTVLGYSFDPLETPSSNPYTSAVRELIPTLFSLSLVRQFAPFLAKLGPPSLRRKLVEWTPIKSVQKVKDMSDVMYNTARSILRQKTDGDAEDAPTSAAGGKDLLRVLMKENKNALHDDKLTEDEIIGQMTVLIFGAQDTTSSALSRLLYMLCTHPDIQEKLRDEIRDAQNAGNIDENGDLDYDILMSLPWLDAVLKETLRLYPPVPFVRRTATKTRRIPLWRAIHSDRSSETPIDSVVIPEGTTLFLGLAAANRSEDVWGPDAKEWKPERWLNDELIQGKASDVPRLPGIYGNGMLTFFGGERSCVGYKFAQVEIKSILATLLSNFEFSPTADRVVWNLSQIISPSVRKDVISPSGAREVQEQQGLPLIVRPIV
ncbi:cytochrome P450 [Gloeophyllum trabeum ATCC 11539]|uniref:Cytochrome P450 n=1 Tax=Gloeophyllum trabeum (strain ATCC 11539 / FP-39264 / Madison 617) TaxID=670483 RepID=S7R7I3_GLOTA|nr:cytochrome P450 [Gloeophyllum trabeum ATCC 11539]EPQ50340.1 cytochrome P450 [Gloeophyllum trabeum ATCC 11539]